MLKDFSIRALATALVTPQLHWHTSRLPRLQVGTGICSIPSKEQRFYKRPPKMVVDLFLMITELTLSLGGLDDLLHVDTGSNSEIPK